MKTEERKAIMQKVEELSRNASRVKSLMEMSCYAIANEEAADKENFLEGIWFITDMVEEIRGGLDGVYARLREVNES